MKIKQNFQLIQLLRKFSSDYNNYHDRKYFSVVKLITKNLLQDMNLSTHAIKPPNLEID